MKKTIASLVAITIMSGAGFAAPAAHHGAKAAKAKAAPKKAAIICPVTGEKIASADKAVGKSTYKGKTYYFCCSACKPKFDKNPAKYAKNSAKGIYDKM